ncbi:hypothetical protein Gpo141_00004515, partial [Globisporangium polare]
DQGYRTEVGFHRDRCSEAGYHRESLGRRVAGFCRVHCLTQSDLHEEDCRLGTSIHRVADCHLETLDHGVVGFDYDCGEDRLRRKAGRCGVVGCVLGNHRGADHHDRDLGHGSHPAALGSHLEDRHDRDLGHGSRPAALGSHLEDRHDRGLDLG